MQRDKVVVVWNTDDQSSGFDVIDNNDISLQHVHSSEFNTDNIAEDVLAVILSGTDVSPRFHLDHYEDQQRLFHQRRIPVLAICGAFQVMALTFGSKIIDCEKPIYGRTKTIHDEITELLVGLSNPFSVFCKHRWAISELGNDLEPFAWSSGGEYIYGIYRPNYPHWGVQFHPERRNDGTMILRNFVQYAKNIRCELLNKDSSEVFPASDLLRGLPKNEFRALTDIKQRLKEQGAKITDLSEGLPDLPPHNRILNYMKRISSNPDLYCYPTRWGMPSLINQIEQFIENRYDVDPSKWGILPVAGSKEAFAHIAHAFLNAGDTAISPIPGYPIYKVAISYAGARNENYRFDEAGNPILDSNSNLDLESTKLMFITSPNNPTGKVISREGISLTLSMCSANKIILCQDMAYAELSPPERSATSLLTLAKRSQPVIEVHSLSKSLSLPGIRFGFIIGNKSLVDQIEVSKAVFDTGLFPVVQKLARYALANFDEFNSAPKETYNKRIVRSNEILRKAGIETDNETSGIFTWLRVNEHQGSGSMFCERLLKEDGILVLPGAAFGEPEDTHVRISLTAPEPVLDKAIGIIAERLRSFRNKNYST